MIQVVLDHLEPGQTKKKSVYMELKNIFSLIPIHFLNKLGL